MEQKKLFSLEKCNFVSRYTLKIILLNINVSYRYFAVTLRYFAVLCGTLRYFAVNSRTLFELRQFLFFTYFEHT